LNALWKLGNYDEAGMFVTNKGYLVLPTHGVDYSGKPFANDYKSINWLFIEWVLQMEYFK